MARLLEQLEKNTQLDKVIYKHDLMPEEELTAKQVWEYSDKLAFYLNETYKEDKSPIVVYGHKHPFMLVLKAEEHSAPWMSTLQSIA